MNGGPPPPEERDTHARLMAKVDGFQEHIDEALESACQQLLNVVKLERLEWQQLALSKQRTETACKKDSNMPLPFLHVQEPRFDEYWSDEAREYADEATAILNSLFGDLDHYLRYYPSARL